MQLTYMGDVGNVMRWRVEDEFYIDEEGYRVTTYLCWTARPQSWEEPGRSGGHKLAPGDGTQESLLSSPFQVRVLAGALWYINAYTTKDNRKDIYHSGGFGY